MEFGGLVIELFAILGLPLLIPICIVLVAGKLSHNEKLQKIMLFIFSLIYNAIVGFISFLLLICLTFLFGSIFNMKITLAIAVCVFAIILIPISKAVIKSIGSRGIGYFSLSY